jgi:hypothetical protein
MSYTPMKTTNQIQTTEQHDLDNAFYFRERYRDARGHKFLGPGIWGTQREADICDSGEILDAKWIDAVKLPFKPLADAARFVVVAACWEVWIPEDELRWPARVRERRIEEYRAGVYPESYLHVPQVLSTAVQFPFHELPRHERGRALSEVAARNFRLSKRFDPSSVPPWYIALELGQAEGNRLCTVQLSDNGVGGLLIEGPQPVRVVRPTVEEFERHLIEWEE